MKKNIISAILLAALSLVLVFVLCAPAFASDSQPSDQASEPAVLSAPTETAEEAAGKINSAMMLGLVFIETAIIYALIIAILIIFVL